MVAASSGKRPLKSFLQSTYVGTSATLQVARLDAPFVAGCRSSPACNWESPFMANFNFDRPWYEDRNGEKYCLLCSAFATEGHLTSSRHSEREQHPEWYGGPGSTAIAEEFNKPWFVLRGTDQYCLLCSSYATDGHLASEKHRNREAHPQHYGFPAHAGSGPAPTSSQAQLGQLVAYNPSVMAVQPRVVPREYQQPYFDFREGEWYCTLCSAWATEGHLGGQKHVKRAQNPEWYMAMQSPSAAAYGGPATYSPPLALTAGPAPLQPLQPLQPELPVPWERHFSDQYNRWYYHNRQTGVTTWDSPTDVQQMRQNLQQAHVQQAAPLGSQAPAGSPQPAGGAFLAPEGQVPAVHAHQAAVPPYSAAPSVAAPVVSASPVQQVQLLQPVQPVQPAQPVQAAQPLQQQDAVSSVPIGAALPSNDLPPGWTRYWSDRDQKHYYHCPATHVTQWEVPEEHC